MRRLSQAASLALSLTACGAGGGTTGAADAQAGAMGGQATPGGSSGGGNVTGGQVSAGGGGAPAGGMNVGGTTGGESAPDAAAPGSDAAVGGSSPPGDAVTGGTGGGSADAGDGGATPRVDAAAGGGAQAADAQAGGAAPPADALAPDVGPPPVVQDDAALRINEFMASNHFSIEDPEGRSSDWIELYNGGQVDVDLEGYRVTNGFDDAARVTELPAGMTIAAGGYVMLWADGRSQLGGGHLRFNLPREPSSIGLARPGPAPLDQSWLDRVEYGAQTPDISAARMPDGSNAWQTLWEITPGAANPNGRGRPSPNEPRPRPDSAPSFDQAVERLFNGLPEFHLTIAEEHIQALRDDPRAYVPGSFTYNGREVGPVGIRIKGQNSFLPIDQKPSLKISVSYDDNGALFHGLQFITLNNMRSDLSMLKEVIGYYMARTVGLFASRAGHALVYINDEFYGVYTNLENIDSHFLSRWFADVTGPLYEGFDVDFRPEMVNRACVEGEDPNRPGCFELESGEDDRTSLVGLANALTMPAPQSIEQAAEFVSFDQFHLYWAVCANIGQFDSFPYSNPGDDYHLYVEPESGQITLIPWGMDETFLAGRNVAQVTSHLAQRCLEDRLCNDGWAQQVWLVNDTMNAIDLAGEVDARAAIIAPYVDMDLHKPYTTDQVAGEQARVRAFIVQRAGALMGQVPRE